MPLLGLKNQPIAKPIRCHHDADETRGAFPAQVAARSELSDDLPAFLNFNGRAGSARAVPFGNYLQNFPYCSLGKFRRMSWLLLTTPVGRNEIRYGNT